MLNRKFAVLSLAAAALLVLQIAGTDTVNSGVIDPCESSASSNTGTIFGCPVGDGDNLGAAGLTISVTVKDNVGAPVPNVPAADIWLDGCSGGLAWCGGTGAINAIAATDVNGQTTITGDLPAGGCDNTGLRVVAQGIVIGAGGCGDPCIQIKVRTPDFSGDLKVDIVDFSSFKNGPPIYPVDPAANDCRDFNNDLKVEIVDFAKFAGHTDINDPLGHHCPNL